jgi:diguanylate cyclase (GGDEF)-like protein/PAS domain S-box-containing protein
MANLLKAKRVVWGLIFLLVTAVAGLSYFSGDRYLAAARAVEEALAVRSAIDATLSLLKDAEASQRGFILTGDSQFLMPHEAANEGLPRHLAELRRAIGNDARQKAHLQVLERLANDKLTFTEQTIDARRDGDLAGALARVRTGRGREIMEAIRSETRAMDERAHVILRERRREAENIQRLAALGIGVGSLLTVLLALFSLLTVHRDVQALQRAAEEAAASEEHYRLLTENTSDLVQLIDLNGKTIYVSPSVERLLGYGVEEFLALPAEALMHPDEKPMAAALLADIATGATLSGIATYRLRNKAGEYRHLEVRWSVHVDGDGAPVNIHTTGRDVTERKQAEEQLAEQAAKLRSLSLRDELTTLYNRRGFLEIAGQALAQAARDHRAAALIFVDLNGMKRINDDFGHEAGDSALLDTATVLGKALREADVMARLGGDEFAVLALDFTAGDVGSLRGRLRFLADQETAERDRPYRLSMSVGAAFSEAGSRTTLLKLLETADLAMYEQKRARQAAGNVSIRPEPPRAAG